MIKKIIICLIFVIISTGCFKNEDFVKICKVENKTTNYKETTKYTISYNNKDEVTKVVIEKKYNITDSDILNLIKENTQKYNKNLEKIKGIKSKIIDEDKYTVTYTLDVPKMEDKYLKSLNVKRNSLKYFNYLQKNNIECTNSNV